jgi:3-oxoacyl-[acyl-carrier protein] reductase
MERVLQGRVALVTGVSRRKGIRFAVADRLAAMGADVFCHAFTPYDVEQPWGADRGGLNSLHEELLRHGTRVEFMEADFTDPRTHRLLPPQPAPTIGCGHHQNL